MGRWCAASTLAALIFLVAAAPARAADAPAGNVGSAWPDRRPIGVIQFAANEFRTADNPRGWNPTFHGKLRASDPVYSRQFRSAVLKHVDHCVLRAKRYDCQAVLIWDLEGQEFDHPISYLGDPRVLPPEMPTALAKEIGEKFTAANIKVGGTLRPTSPVQTAYGIKQIHCSDPATALTAKVNYARIFLGWRVFYIDSNVAIDSWSDGKAKPLGAELFQKLSETYRDSLFIPEWSDASYYRVPRLAPYRSTGGDPRPAEVARQGSFEVVAARGTLEEMLKVKSQLVDAARGGDVFLILVDRDLPEHQDFVMDVVREGKLAK